MTDAFSWRRWLGAWIGSAPPGPVADDTGVLAPGDPLPQPVRSARAVLLPVPHQRQEDWLCVPTAASMVLAWRGEQRSPRELKQLSRGLPYDPQAPFTDHTLTFFRDLLQGLKTLGHDWQEVSFRTDRAGFQQGLETIRQQLQQDCPVLVDTSLFGGHTLVVAGFDDTRQQLWMVDPHVDAPGWRVLPYLAFETVWHSRGTGFDGRAALLTGA